MAEKPTLEEQITGLAQMLTNNENPTIVHNVLAYAVLFNEEFNKFKQGKSFSSFSDGIHALAAFFVNERQEKSSNNSNEFADRMRIVEMYNDLQNNPDQPYSKNALAYAKLFSEDFDRFKQGKSFSDDTHALAAFFVNERQERSSNNSNEFADRMRIVEMYNDLQNNPDQPFAKNALAYAKLFSEDFDRFKQGKSFSDDTHALAAFYVNERQEKGSNDNTEFAERLNKAMEYASSEESQNNGDNNSTPPKSKAAKVSTKPKLQPGQVANKVTIRRNGTERTAESIFTMKNYALTSNRGWSKIGLAQMTFSVAQKSSFEASNSSLAAILRDYSDSKKHYLVLNAKVISSLPNEIKAQISPTGGDAILDIQPPKAGENSPVQIDPASGDIKVTIQSKDSGTDYTVTIGAGGISVEYDGHKSVYAVANNEVIDTSMTTEFFSECFSGVSIVKIKGLEVDSGKINAKQIPSYMLNAFIQANDRNLQSDEVQTYQEIDILPSRYLTPPVSIAILSEPTSSGGVTSHYFVREEGNSSSDDPKEKISTVRMVDDKGTLSSHLTSLVLLNETPEEGDESETLKSPSIAINSKSRKIFEIKLPMNSETGEVDSSIAEAVKKLGEFVGDGTSAIQTAPDRKTIALSQDEQYADLQTERKDGRKTAQIKQSRLKSKNQISELNDENYADVEERLQADEQEQKPLDYEENSIQYELKKKLAEIEELKKNAERAELEIDDHKRNIQNLTSQIIDADTIETVDELLEKANQEAETAELKRAAVESAAEQAKKISDEVAEIKITDAVTNSMIRDINRFAWDVKSALEGANSGRSLVNYYLDETKIHATHRKQEIPSESSSPLQAKLTQLSQRAKDSLYSASDIVDVDTVSQKIRDFIKNKEGKDLWEKLLDGSYVSDEALLYQDLVSEFETYQSMIPDSLPPYDTISDLIRTIDGLLASTLSEDELQSKLTELQQSYEETQTELNNSLSDVKAQQEKLYSMLTPENEDDSGSRIDTEGFAETDSFDSPPPDDEMESSDAPDDFDAPPPEDEDEPEREDTSPPIEGDDDFVGPPRPPVDGSSSTRRIRENPFIATAMKEAKPAEFKLKPELGYVAIGVGIALMLLLSLLGPIGMIIGTILGVGLAAGGYIFADSVDHINNAYKRIEKIVIDPLLAQEREFENEQQAFWGNEASLHNANEECNELLNALQAGDNADMSAWQEFFADEGVDIFGSEGMNDFLAEDNLADRQAFMEDLQIYHELLQQLEANPTDVDLGNRVAAQRQKMLIEQFGTEASGRTAEEVAEFEDKLHRFAKSDDFDQAMEAVQKLNEAQVKRDRLQERMSHQLLEGSDRLFDAVLNENKLSQKARTEFIQENANVIARRLCFQNATEVGLEELLSALPSEAITAIEEAVEDINHTRINLESAIETKHKQDNDTKALTSLTDTLEEVLQEERQGATFMTDQQLSDSVEQLYAAQASQKVKDHQKAMDLISEMTGDTLSHTIASQMSNALSDATINSVKAEYEARDVALKNCGFYAEIGRELVVSEASKGYIASTPLRQQMEARLREAYIAERIAGGEDETTARTAVRAMDMSTLTSMPLTDTNAQGLRNAYQHDLQAESLIATQLDFSTIATSLNTYVDVDGTSKRYVSDPTPEEIQAHIDGNKGLKGYTPDQQKAIVTMCKALSQKAKNQELTIGDKSAAEIEIAKDDIERAALEMILSGEFKLALQDRCIAETYEDAPSMGYAKTKVTEAVDRRKRVVEQIVKPNEANSDVAKMLRQVVQNATTYAEIRQGITSALASDAALKTQSGATYAAVINPTGGDINSDAIKKARTRIEEQDKTNESELKTKISAIRRTLGHGETQTLYDEAKKVVNKGKTLAALPTTADERDKKSKKVDEKVLNAKKSLDYANELAEKFENAMKLPLDEGGKYRVEAIQHILSDIQAQIDASEEPDASEDVMEITKLAQKYKFPMPKARKGQAINWTAYKKQVTAHIEQVSKADADKAQEALKSSKTSNKQTAKKTVKRKKLKKNMLRLGKLFGKAKTIATAREAAIAAEAAAASTGSEPADTLELDTDAPETGSESES